MMVWECGRNCFKWSSICKGNAHILHHVLVSCLFT